MNTSLTFSLFVTPLSPVGWMRAGNTAPKGMTIKDMQVDGEGRNVDRDLERWAVTSLPETSY